MDLESGLFRILDEALAAYLGAAPGDGRAPARLVGRRRGDGRRATRAGASLAGVSREPDVPDGADLPPALAAMIEDRRADARRRGRGGAEPRAIVALPPTTWREIQSAPRRSAWTPSCSTDGGTLRLTIAPEASRRARGAEPAARASR